MAPVRWLISLVVTVCYLTGNSSSAADQDGSLIPEQASFDVRHCDLDIRIDPARKFIAGTGTIEVEVLRPIDWLVLDLDTPLAVTGVRLASGPEPALFASIEFERRGSRLWIPLKPRVPKSTRVAVAVDYEGCPRVPRNPPWEGGVTWAKTKDDQPWIATSVQVEGASLWWPCKNHPSDKPESFTLRARVPSPLVVASNGRLVQCLTNADGTLTYEWHTGYPIATYNVALNIAPYKTISTNYTSVTGEQVPAVFWVLPENKLKAEKLLPEVLAHLRFYERTLGPYPFRREKYGVAETPFLGMEHQTIIAYGNNYPADPRGYDWLHHHELGHEWWGNLVAARDWRHFWLHEGLCTYMQALYTEEREGLAAYHRTFRSDLAGIRNEYALVPSQPVSLEQMSRTVGNDAYYKGAYVVHMLRFLIGGEQTLTVLRRFAYSTPATERATNGSACRFVTTSDFIQHAEKVSGQKLGWFFSLYLDQPRLPKLVSEVKGDRLLLRWETPPGFSFPMPVEIEANGNISRIEMPKGRTDLCAARYPGFQLDPRGWLLKQ